MARIRRSMRSHGMVCVAASTLGLLLLLPAAGLVHHIYFDRSDLPDLEPFIRFELPTIGEVYDAHGKVLIELAREYRRVVTYDEVPPVLREAILAAEDKNFFSHSGVDYRALPRVVYKTAVHSGGRLAERAASHLPAAFPAGWLDAHPAARPRLLPPGPVSRENGGRALPRQRDVAASRPWSWACPPRTSSCGSSRRSASRSGSRRRCAGATDRRSRPSARSSPATPASSTWATVATVLPPPPSTTSASRCRATRTEDAGKAALLAGITKSPRDYARCPATRGRCAAATRSWP